MRQSFQKEVETIPSAIPAKEILQHQKNTFTLPRWKLLFLTSSSTLDFDFLQDSDPNIISI